MEKDTLPIIDWELATKIAGNNRELAGDLLSMLLTKLPEDLNKINTAAKEKDVKELINLIHRLHGASCYCGVPRLKSVLQKIEKRLKSDDHLAIEGIAELNAEVALLMASAQSI